MKMYQDWYGHWVEMEEPDAEAELSALRARVESLQVELDLERAITRGKDERHATLEALRARVTELEAMQKALHLGIASDAGIIRELRARVGELERNADRRLEELNTVQARMTLARERLATLEATPVVPEGFRLERGNHGSWELHALGSLRESLCWDNPASLRALAYALETGQRPPHASDGKEGGE